MMILISGRIVSSFPDVSKFGKEAVAGVLIAFLVLILLRTLALKYYRRIKHNGHYSCIVEVS
jgi:cytochrome bd-type quinol oxidase subunit 2